MKTGETIEDTDTGIDFLNRIPINTQEIIATINKQDYIKLQSTAQQRKQSS